MITVAILTKNSQAYLKRVLEALAYFDEIIILDSGSVDATIDIAKKFKNTKIYHDTFTNFGNMRNKAAKHAKNDWILALDSDEILSSALIEEIKQIDLNDQKVYSIKRCNYFNNKHIKGCGWHPDFALRLYNKKQFSFKEDLVHEKLDVPKPNIIKMKSPILHYSYNSFEDFLSKMQTYSSLYAKQHQFKKKSSYGKAFFHALFSFFKNYFFKRGLFLGKEGAFISFYVAASTFFKYLKLYEANQKKGEK